MVGHHRLKYLPQSLKVSPPPDDPDRRAVGRSKGPCLHRGGGGERRKTMDAQGLGRTSPRPERGGRPSHPRRDAFQGDRGGLGNERRGGESQFSSWDETTQGTL